MKETFTGKLKYAEDYGYHKILSLKNEESDVDLENLLEEYKDKNIKITIEVDESINRKTCCRCKKSYIVQTVNSGFNPSEYWCQECYRPWWKLVVDHLTRGTPGSDIELYQLLQEYSQEIENKVVS